MVVCQVGSLFRFANGTDTFLLVFGTIGACLQGAAMPAFSLIFGEVRAGKLQSPSPAAASAAAGAAAAAQLNSCQARMPLQPQSYA